MRSRIEPTWGVVATVNEPPELLCAFVAHYLALGAETVHLFLDRPDKALCGILGAVPGVTLTLCDNAYWQGRRPPGHVQRQKLNATRAYETWQLDWLLHVDADEFLVPRDRISDLLVAVPWDKQAAHVQVMERVYDADKLSAATTTLFEGHLRAPIELSPQQRRHAFGDAEPYFNKKGFLGHTAGKSFTRRGLPYRIDCHMPFPLEFENDKKKIKEWRQKSFRNSAWDLDAVLMHFDGLTPLHWLLKLLAKEDDRIRFQALGISSGSGRTIVRNRQMQAVYERRQSANQTSDLVRQVLHLDPGHRHYLAQLGAIRPITVDVADQAQQFFTGRNLDFTQATFDQRLRTLHRDLIVRSGFAG